jgi:hyperosmotically inducible protein
MRLVQAEKTGSRIRRYKEIDMRTMLAIVVAAVAVAPMVAAAQQSTMDKVEKQYDKTTDKMSAAGKDGWLVSKTKIALYADDRVSGRQINVDAKSGVVTLRGKVESAGAKQAAEQVARSVEGVTSVRNELQVVAPGDRKAVDRKDSDIKQAVKDRIAKDPSLKGSDIEVRADKGVVTLTGDAKDLNARARASELARSVDGVRAVKNEVQEKS